MDEHWLADFGGGAVAAGLYRAVDVAVVVVPVGSAYVLKFMSVYSRNTLPMRSQR